MRRGTGRRGAGSVSALGFALHAALGLLLGSLSVGRAHADDRWRARLDDALAPQWIDGVRVTSWPSRPMLDEARAIVEAEIAWADHGTRGAGATICVIDTGLDLGHRDFLDGEGRTRVRWLLDLDADRRGVHGALEAAHGIDERGAVWSREEIDAASARGASVSIDWHGHGTAIASAAAGDDTPSDVGDAGLHAGIAPEAELVIVRALRRGALGFHDEDVVHGARFCVDPRVSDASRTVVLLALGGHDGPHDGTSAYERALSEIVARGAAVVVAAGNDGDRAVHGAGWLVRDEVSQLTVRLPGPEIDDALVVIVVRGAREVRASLAGQPATSWARRGSSTDDGVLSIDATDASATYVIAHGALRSGDLVIEARGAEIEGGALDAWIVESRLGPALFSPRFVGVGASASEEIAIPATADGVIAVGASIARERVTGETGAELVLLVDEAGRASYSSRGPRVDGAPLPTLLAPGGWVVAARSGSLDPSDPDALFAGSSERLAMHRRGEDRVVISGTSVAAAIVAGAIALDRATDAPASIEDRVALAASARAIDAATAPFDRRAGAGLLDLPDYLARRRDEGELAGTLELGCTRTSVHPSSGELAVVVRSRTGGEARVRTRTRGEPWSGTRTMRGGWASVPVTLPPRVVGSVLAIEVEVGGRVAPACEVVVEDAEGAPPLVLASGGCVVTASRPCCGVFPVLAVLVSIARRRRSRLARRVVLGSRP